jgi:hypothetical protein
MTMASDFFLDSHGGDDGPLEVRLRGLQWAEAPAEVRERCWRRLNDWIAEQESEREPERPGQGESGGCDRRTFSRRSAPRRTTLAERWTPPTSDERRAAVD